MLQGQNSKKLREAVGMGKELGLYQLRPVWLASPLTVSRIFPLQQGLFDVVIFDEASQLPVEYSLPAIYRGKTIIVVATTNNCHRASSSQLRSAMMKQHNLKMNLSTRLTSD